MLPVDVLALSTNVAINTEMAEAEEGTAFLFDDVKDTDWFYDSVQYVLEQGIFNSSGENSFSPYDSMTRFIPLGFKTFYYLLRS